MNNKINEHTETAYYDEIVSSKLSFSDFREHLTGPVIAIVAHLIALPLTLMLVVIPATPPQEIIKIEPRIAEPDPPPERKEEKIERIEEPEPIEIERPEVERPELENDVDVPDVSEEIVLSNDQPADPTIAFNITDGGPLIIPNMYKDRTGGNRGKRVGELGGTKEAQARLVLGLSWLAQVQNADGSWGDRENTKPAMTALAILAFLAHGDLPSSVRYGEHVSKGLRKLVEYANIPDRRGKGIKCDNHQYGHAIVAYALAEGAAMTRIPLVIEAMERTTKTIVDGMNKDGGYHYNYTYGADNPNSDLSYGGWNYQALKAAFVAGAKVPGLAEALERSIDGIKRNKAKNGKHFFYDNSTPNSTDMAATLTPVGVLCLQLLGDGKSKEAREGVEWITKERGGSLLDMDWKVRGQRSNREVSWCLYAWYYQTQVLFQASEGRKNDPDWKRWQKSFERALVAEQHTEGYWESPAEKYKHKGVGFAETAAASLESPMSLRVYSTALCCLMLEVYYRHLPTYQLVTAKPEINGVDPDEELITID